MVLKMNPVLETIKSRRSVRKYQSRQIKDEELEKILEAAIYAPSGHNDQSWHFTIIHKKKSDRCDQRRCQGSDENNGCRVDR